MKRNRFHLWVAGLACLTLTSCSSYDSSEYFSLSSPTSICAQVFDGFDWITSSREYSLGHYRPPLYKVEFADNYLVIYPVRTKYRGFVGPVLLSLLPVPNKLSVPSENNVLRLFSSKPGVLRIQKINGVPVDQKSIRKEDIPLGVELSCSLGMEDVGKRELEVEISIDDKVLILNFSKEKFRHYIPLLVP